MATALDLVNRALVELGANKVAALSPDDSPNAATAYDLHQAVLDQMLASHPWTFATRRRQLSRIAGDPPAQEWPYRYALPSDTLRVWRILDETGLERSARYLLRTDDSTNERQVYTDLNPCWAEITRRTPFEQLPAQFSQAYVSMLAARLALPITREGSIVEPLMRRAMLEVAGAKAQDWNEQPTPEFDDGDNKLNAKYGF